MRIWILNHYAVPLQYYPHARPHYFAKLLKEKGNDVTVFAASSVHNSDVNLITDKSPFLESMDNGVKYVFLKASSYQDNGLSRIKNMFEYFWRVLRYARRYEKPDIIVAMSVHPLACVAGIQLAKRYKCKCIVDIADLWPESFVAFGIIKKTNPILKILYQGEKWIYKKADAVIFTMEGGAQYLADKGWDKEIDMSKVFHINNGVDLELFDSNRDTYRIEDEDLDQEDVFKVVYTGSIRHTTNIMQVVKAAEEFRDTEVVFLIYGDGDEREELEKYCCDNDINNVKFKGRVDKKFVPYILSKSDLNLINVRSTDIWLKYGSSENKLFEYLAGGKPICSNVKVNYSIIERFACGTEENITDKKRYAEIIKTIKGMDSDNYSQLCSNARRAAEEYDFHVLVDKLEKIIVKCL